MGAYRRQLIDARNSIRIKNVAGKCSDTAEFADLVNRACEKLIKRGAWFGTEILARFCVYGCRVVWPRYVSTVLPSTRNKFLQWLIPILLAVKCDVFSKIVGLDDVVAEKLSSIAGDFPEGWH